MDKRGRRWAEGELRFIYDRRHENWEKVVEEFNRYFYPPMSYKKSTFYSAYRTALSRFGEPQDFYDVSPKTINDCYKSLMTAVLERGKLDYFDAMDKKDHIKKQSIERWVERGNFWIFCWLPLDPEQIIKAWNKEYKTGKRKYVRNSKSK